MRRDRHRREPARDALLAQRLSQPRSDWCALPCVRALSHLCLSGGPPSTAGGQTLTVSEWRAAAWNRYYDNTPFSWDVTSPNISDAPPFRLSWTMGTDAPLPQKDGHGCLFKQRWFVIAGGEWCYAVNTANTTQPSPPCIPDTKTYVYDLVTEQWSELPPPAFTMFRTTGACGKDALYLVSGMSPNMSAVPRGLADAARLTMVDGGGTGDTVPRWEWTLLPKLPQGAERWLGAAGVVDGWLVIASGANACGFEDGDHRDQADAVGQGQHVGSGHDPCFVPCTDATRCPPWLPSYRLRVQPAVSGTGSSEGGLGTAWESIAKFPGGGLDVPNAAVAGGSLYLFGGWKANGPGMAAWKELYGLDLPVPIAKGTNGARLLRAAWKYTPATDHWEQLPDLPQHMCSGGTTVLKDRYIVQVGSAYVLASKRNAKQSSMRVYLRPYN